MVDTIGDKTVVGTITTEASVVTILDVSASSDAVDVTGKTMIRVDTVAGNIVLGGFTGGIEGQIIYVVKINSSNTVTLEHNEATGTEKIITIAGTDRVLTSWGGCTLTYLNSGGTLYWFILE